MKLKKLLSVVISLTLLLSLISLPAFADNKQTASLTIGGETTYYQDFGYAYVAIPADNTNADDAVITLWGDHTYSVRMTFDRAFTLDLNGYTFTNNIGQYSGFNAQKDLTIRDTSAGQDGVLYSAHCTGAAIVVGKNNGAAATLTLQSGCIQSETCIFDTWDNATINVEGGKMVSYSKYGTGDSRSIVKELCSGCALNISGGEFRSDQSARSFDTMSFDPMGYPTKTINPNSTITVTGGSFSGQAIQKYIPGYTADQSFSNANPTITVGDYTVTRTTISSPYGAAPYDVFLYTVEPMISYVAQIGDTGYASLADAIAAVPTDGTKTTITMLADEALASGVTVAAGKNIVLDLNGFTVSEALSQSGTTALITNRGTLTIKDSTDVDANGTGTGKITYFNGLPDPAAIPGYASNAIINNGTLTIESGLIENRTNGGYAAYTVDNLTNGGLYTPVFTMNGGRLYNNYSDAVRMFLNSDSKLNKVVINGGVLDSDKASGRVIVIHNPNAKVNKGELDITGGTINGKVNGWSAANAGGVEDRFSDAQYAEISINISGGNIRELSFTEMANETLRAAALQVTGGKYKVNPSAYVSTGYESVAISEDPYFFQVVPAVTYVAQIGDAQYTTLAAAFAAAGDGDTITLLTDVTDATMGANGIVVNGSNTINLDLNGYDITCTNGSAASSRMIKITGTTTLNVYNSSSTQSVMDVLGDNEPVVNKDTTTTLPYGVFRAEIGTTLNITGTNGNLKLKNGRAWGLNIKLLGANATITGVIIDSQYGGGIEVTEADLGGKTTTGYAELTDCTFTQTGYFDHCSTAVSVSGDSELVVNSGTYTSENYAIYVFSSGGYVTVNGGTFVGLGSVRGFAFIAAIDTNTYSGYEGGLVFKAGNFSGNFSITDPATAVITGGTFNTNPSAYVAKGYEAIDNNNGTWTVGAVKAGELTKTATQGDADATYTLTKQVVDENDNVIDEGTNRTVNVKVVSADDTSVNTAEEIISNLSMDKVLDSVVAKIDDAVDTVKVEIQVASGDTNVDEVNNTITYEVHPEATIYVNDQPAGTVTISNDALADDAVFTIKLAVPNNIAEASANGNITVTHISADYGTETAIYPLQGEKDNYYVQFDVTHFSEFVVEANGSLFTGHSVTLNGYINLNFYLNLSQSQVTTGEGTVVDFTWGNGSASHTVALGDYVVGRGYKATVALPAAEMTYDITATVKINDVTQSETSTYSVRQYADELLAITSDTKLINLVNAMLDYGAKAQIAFNSNVGDLANDGIAYTMPDVTREDLLYLIDQALLAANNGARATVVRDVAEAIGAEAYYSSSLIYLSGCTLRHYFYGTDLDVTKFTGVKSDHYYYIDKENIAAADLDKLQAFTVGGLTFHYSALDFVKAIIYNYTDGANYDLAAATYWYNQAANAYFE